MNPHHFGRIFAATILVASVHHHATAQDDEFLNYVQDALTFSAQDDNVRIKVSGLVDLEYYSLPETSPGLIFTDEDSLWNPRLTLFLDGQIGPHFYLFAQSRVDRGFDPSKYDAQMRLDEFAIRLTPWEDGRFSLQAGQFATVVGSWVHRHLSWDNPFVNAPLAYENLTGIWHYAPVKSPNQLLDWGHVPNKRRTKFGNGFYDKHLRLPMVWGPSYATGVSASGKLGDFVYAVEAKNSSLASAPESWPASEVGFEYPTVSGRFGYQPSPAWNLGVSGSTGPYLNPDLARPLAPGTSLGDLRQSLVGFDISYAHHHWQIWGEIMASRFDVPTVGNADTVAYFVEAKYKFTPQLYWRAPVEPAIL
ncbi:MAG: hypothetical protein ACI8UO_005964 [Verrucomicrobiales bacterium]|jgi:hypothetical protein